MSRDERALRLALSDLAGRDWKHFRLAQAQLADLLEEEGRDAEAALTRAPWRRAHVRARSHYSPEVEHWECDSAAWIFDAAPKGFARLFLSVNEEPLLHFAPGELKLSWRIGAPYEDIIDFVEMSPDDAVTLHWTRVVNRRSRERFDSAAHPLGFRALFWRGLD